MLNRKVKLKCYLFFFSFVSIEPSPEIRGRTMVPPSPENSPTSNPFESSQRPQLPPPTQRPSSNSSAPALTQVPKRRRATTDEEEEEEEQEQQGERKEKEDEDEDEEEKKLPKSSPQLPITSPTKIAPSQDGKTTTAVTEGKEQEQEKQEARRSKMQQDEEESSLREFLLGKVQCPVCELYIAADSVNNHLDVCLAKPDSRENFHQQHKSAIKK